MGHALPHGRFPMVVALLGLVLLAGPNEVPEGLAPGDGIGLAPNPIARTQSSDSSPGSRRRPPLRYPAVPLAAVASVGALGVGVKRRREDPLIVVVHGHGGAPRDFDFLVANLDVPPDRVVAFDYTTVQTDAATSTDASRRAPTSAAAMELDLLIRGLAEENANIYSIHHSRGGAVGVEMIANLDTGVRPPIDGYRGAALLDPAIDRGLPGALQSSGSRWGIAAIPSDGGFDPIRCDDSRCIDVREYLGERSGVEVVAIRNRDAVFPNFYDEPKGLRVFDLPDNKVSALLYGLVFAPWFFTRSREAHASVLVSGAVADCLGSEIVSPGSCTELKPPPPAYVPAQGAFVNVGRHKLL